MDGFCDWNAIPHFRFLLLLAVSLQLHGFPSEIHKIFNVWSVVKRHHKNVRTWKFDHILFFPKWKIEQRHKRDHRQRFYLFSIDRLRNAETRKRI